jgi:hypothetical protein
MREGKRGEGEAASNRQAGREGDKWEGKGRGGGEASSYK